MVVIAVRPIVLVIRHPDYGNEYVVDGDVETIDIDLGSSFNGTPDDSGQAEEWVESINYWLDGVPVTSPVFAAVVETVLNTVGRFDAARGYVDQYVTDRMLAAATIGEGHEQDRA